MPRKPIKPKAKKAAPKGKTAARKKPSRPEKSMDSEKLAVPAKPKPKPKPFPIVGIGASAGGLEAFEKFFSSMPEDTGMAFILVQHLDSEHKSILAQLIGQYTTMKVTQVTEGEVIQPNHVYVIPPNRDLSILNRVLYLMEPDKPRGQRMTIDHFFRALAEDAKGESIAIVLSGTGSDGAVGLRAVKEVNGMAMVQEPATAKFDGMPVSAVNTGLVDYILPPEEMPRKLISFAARKGIAASVEDITLAKGVRDGIQKILILLRTQVKHDFSQYKENTVVRRVERRMAVNQVKSIEEYFHFLQRNRDEVNILFKELLIGVSNFFRDPDAFEALKKMVIPALLSNRRLDQPIRVWVPACSTGEEPYSIAILFQEEMERLNVDYKVQIFTTDIDKDAIETARKGLYPKAIAADVTPERLKRFFIQDEDAFQVKKQVREMLVIAEQSVIKDPPFSALDLISCRNLMIYFGTELQEKVLPIFHYALSSKGHLFLGTSETVGRASHLFKVVDRKWKIYQRKDVSIARETKFEAPAPPPLPGTVVKPAEKLILTKEDGFKQETEAALLSEYAATCIIINDKYDPLYVQGHTGKYLEVAQGKVSWNLLKMAKKELLPDLTTAVRKVKTDGKEIRYMGLRVGVNGGAQSFNLIVKPFRKPSALEGCMAVIFEDIGKIQPVDEKEKKPPKTPGDKDKRIAELEKQLKSTKEYLQTTIEELESSNEEMKSTNEEMQASNEELQSANEELETSKEEAQSVNEELATVNSEYEGKINELTKANDDMVNLMASTDIGTLFLDLNLHVRRYTPAVTKFINLIPGDINRPLAHIVSNLDYETLNKDAETVLDTLVPREKEIQSKEGQWLSIRIRPFRTTENVIDGVVITFVDNTERKRSEARACIGMNRFHRVFDSPMMGVLFVDFEGNIADANDAFLNIVGYSRRDLKAGKVDWKKMTPPEFIPQGLKAIEELKRKGSFEPFEKEYIRKDGERVRVLLGAGALEGEDNDAIAFVIDLTGKYRLKNSS